MPTRRGMTSTAGAVLLVTLYGSLHATDTDASGPPERAPRIPVERLDVPTVEKGAPPTLKHEQRGTIFELWFPSVDGMGFRQDEREPPPPARQPAPHGGLPEPRR
jgi:hypothetical protein